ncbi:MAG: sodium:calcium antiporter [Gemmatimonadales bacterium]|nr:MAG: sodium:calcium antiporter [Gemmatimonadales bacterium]
MAAALLAGGVVLLWAGAEAMVRGSITLGLRLAISPMVIGLTVVSIGTSAPELVVSALAALRGSPDIAVGNVLGSNLANVGLVLGIAALLSPLVVARQVVRREIPWMLAITVLAFPLFLDLNVGRWEGGALALLLLLYLGFLVPAARKEDRTLLGDAAPKLEGPAARRISGARDVLVPLAMVAAGVVGLVAGGQGIVRGATEVASALGISELVIGLGVVAVGTSLPELATTILAALRREADLAVGNIVGSNIFNLTFVLGGAAFIHPLDIPERVLRVEFPAAFLVSLLLLPLAWSGRTLGRLEGLLLLGAYGAAWAWILTAG